MFSSAYKTDYGSPLFDEKEKVIGFVTYIEGLNAKYIGFVRIHKVFTILDKWKGRLKKLLEKKRNSDTTSLIDQYYFGPNNFILN